MFFEQASPREILNQKYNIKNPDVDTLCKVIQDENCTEAEKIQIVKLHLLLNVCAGSMNKNGDTPLHFAAAEDSTEVLRLLLDSNRGYVNVVDETLSTPLHWAAYNGKADNVKLLVEYGAKDRENALKGTAYESGKINGYSFPGLDQSHQDMERKQKNKNEAINQLKALGLENDYNQYIGYPYERALLEASEKGDLTKVRLLFTAGTNLNTTRDDRGYRPLHLAVIKGHLDVVTFLLNNGAETDTKNNLGLTALWYAEVDNKIEMIALLTTQPNSITPDSAGSFMDSFSGGKVALPQEQLAPRPATIVLSSQPELVNKSEMNNQPSEQEMKPQTIKTVDEKPDSFAERLVVLINSAKQVLEESEEKPRESIPDHFATPKRDSHQSGQAHQDFFAPPPLQINHSQNTVERLQHSKSRNDELSRLIGLPDFVNISDAFATGDCFYDSMAQALNSLFDASEYTHQKLRQLCFNAISELEQSKSPTYTWLKNAVEHDSPGMTFEEYRMRMQYDASSLEELKAADTLIPWGDVIWGRPHIEGKLLCDLLGVKLHVIEVQDVPEGPAKQIVTEQLIDPNIDNGKSKSIETLDRKTFAPDSGYVHLLVTRGHFEPILPNSQYHTMTQDEVLREIWLGCGHDDRNADIIGLWNKYPQYRDYILTYHNYQALRHAAEHSETNFAFFFEKMTQAQKDEILPLKDFQAFRVAVLEGHIGSVKLLWGAANPNMKEKLLAAKDYHHFGVAFLRPQVKVIEFLWSVADEKQRTMVLQKLFDNRHSLKSREWSLTSLHMKTKLYAEILEIMEKNASENQLVLIRQFPYHKLLTKMPQPVTEKSTQLGTSSCEGSPSTPQPLAQKSIQSSVQKVDVPDISSLISSIGVFKVEKKKSVSDSIINTLFGEEYNVFPGIIDKSIKLRKFDDSTDEEKSRCTTILKDAGIDFAIEKSVLGGVIYSIQNETTTSLTNKLEKAFYSKQLTANAMMY